MSVVNTSDDRYACSNFIVAKTLAEGANYTTIADALADASSGDIIFIKPGTYVEDLTLVGGVDMVAFGEGGALPDVHIIGKCTHNDGGDVSLHGLRLNTNSDFFLEMSGTENSRLRLEECYFQCSNNTGISFSATAGNIFCSGCEGAIADSGSTFIVSTSTRPFSMRYCNIANGAGSTLASSTSSGQLNFQYSIIAFALESNGLSGNFNVEYSTIDTSAINTTCVETSGNATSTFANCIFDGGTATAISVGTATTVSMLGHNEVRSTATDTIDGLGTLEYAPISFSGSSNNALISTSSQTIIPIGKSIEVVDDILTSGDRASDLGSITNAWDNLYVDGISFDDGTNSLDAYEEGTYTPTIIGSTGAIGAQTYSSQIGFYTLIGDRIMLWGHLILSNIGSWTGTATLAGFPFSGVGFFSTSGSRQFIEGRDLTITDSNTYLVTNDEEVSGKTDVGIGAGGDGGSGANQLYSGLTNASSIRYIFSYPV